MQKALRYLDTSFKSYPLTEELSSNSSALVFRSQSLSAPEQVVVVKILTGFRLETQQQGDAFLKRCAVLQQLPHPHLLPLIDAGIEEQVPYTISAYAGRRPLSRRLSGWKRRLPPRDFALLVLRQAGQALHFLHQQGLTHGNLKVGNVLFDVQENVLLADFAQTAIASEEKSELAVEENYRAPELRSGAETTPASDQYALGCLAYELFSGQPPFVVFSPNIAGKYYRTRKLIPPRRYNPALSAEIERVILKAMNPDPGQRFSNIAEFLAELEAQTLQAWAENNSGESGQRVKDNTVPLLLVKDETATQAAKADEQATGSGMAIGYAPGRLQLIGKHATPRVSTAKKRLRIPLLVLSLLMVLGVTGTVFLALAQVAQHMPQGMTTQVGPGGATQATAPASTATLPSQTFTSPPRLPLPAGTAIPVVPAPTEKPTTQATKVPTPATTPTPTHQQLACAVTAKKTNTWNTGFTASMYITNTSSKTINGWELAWRFDGDQKMTNVWNAKGDQNSQIVELHNLSWNSSITSGQTIEIGMNVSFHWSDHLPTKFWLNGLICQ